MAHDSSVHNIETKILGIGIDTIYLYPILFFLVWFLAFRYLPEEAVFSLKMYAQLSVFWLPYLLLFVFWDQWVHYVWSLFLTKQKYCVLEVRLPQEINKSPLAMELFLATLYQSGRETTFIDRLWLGKVRLHFSLEIASFEGDVRFFIWTPSLVKQTLEARIYAQYPEVEVHEVPDYTRRVRYDEKKMDLWGVEYRFVAPNPYPIKTYVDFGLDRDPKEEHKVDPVSHLLEFFGALRQGEYMWVQFIIRSHTPNQRLGFKFTKDNYKEDLKHEIEGILATVPGAEEGRATYHQLSERDKRRLEAMQTKASKQLFDVGIRAIYFAKKENYDSRNTSPGLHPLFRHLQTSDLNPLANTRGMGTFDYFWQDLFGIRKPAMRRRLFKHFQDRSYFWVPYANIPVVLNSEELATLYHFPGEVVKAPTLERIPSRKAGAPANLPI